MSEPMTDQEIAKALGISPSSVHVYVERAMRKLKDSEAMRQLNESLRDQAHRRAVRESTTVVSRVKRYLRSGD